ncbi:MAG: hypothetical protein R2681_12525 [Pyrinomonadaceae bacterium]
MKKLFLLSVIIGLSVVFGFGQSASQGTIKGKLMYPSDYIPDTMIVCVQDYTKTFCSDSESEGFVFDLDYENARYSIKLPAGKYYVFAAFPYGKAPTNDMEGYEAYYNEFVTCGLSVDCTSRKKIEVTVKPNATVSEITPGDWYKPLD